MQTQCPSCQTRFRVRAEELRAANGRVRCGVCRASFDAIDSLRPDPPDYAVAEGTGGAPPIEDLALAGLSDEAAAADEEPPVAAQRLPLSAHLGREARGRALSGWFLALVSLPLIAALATQWLYYDRVRLITEPELRPWVLRLCEYLPCTEPPLRDVADIELLERAVFVHPTIDDALMISGTMVNNASFAQPLPLLEVKLSNLRGELMAARRFVAQEYLRDKDARRLMEPGVAIAIRLEVLDPGSSALAYEFDFL